MSNKKDIQFKMRVNEQFKKDVEYISKMEDTKGMSATIEYLVKQQLKSYTDKGIIRK